MLLLKILIPCSLVSNNFREDETTPVTLGDRIQDYLDFDPTTKNILDRIYKRPITDQFKGLLHLSLNNLLVSNEILASSKPEDSPGLKQTPDFIQRENQEMLNHLDSEEKKREI